MIELYTWKTPNSQKVNIAVCELDLDVDLRPIDIGKGDQRAPAYLDVNPNAKVPAILDRDTGIKLMESGAILLYLAERTGRLVPADDAGRWDAIQWVFWQMAGLGPAAGQFNHFQDDESRGVYARERFAAELARLAGVLDRRLAGRDFIAGAYSIADIAVWPWLSRYERLKLDLSAYPNVLAWYRAVAARPAVIEGFRMLQPEARIPVP